MSLLIVPSPQTPSILFFLVIEPTTNLPLLPQAHSSWVLSFFAKRLVLKFVHGLPLPACYCICRRVCGEISHLSTPSGCTNNFSSCLMLR